MSDELISKEAIDNLLEQGAKSAEKAERARKKKVEDVDGDDRLTEPGDVAVSIDSSDEPGVERDSDVQLYPASEQIRSVQFAQLNSVHDGSSRNPLDMILDVELQVTVELGRTTMQVRDILELGPGSVVELQKLAGEPVEMIVNNKLVARGEVVVIDENFGIRVTEIVSQAERVNTLK